MDAETDNDLPAHENWAHLAAGNINFLGISECPAKLLPNEDGVTVELVGEIANMVTLALGPERKKAPRWKRPFPMRTGVR